ncbi:MAG: hypothetical protein U9N12_07040 [Euryarchaeota archaeon]|nr:hypothetical protein [Euryarchaeota archaeon]
MPEKIQAILDAMERRLVVARAMLSNPEILLLYEPTTGLDLQSRMQVWESIKNLKKSGKTVLLTTHYIEEADVLCDRIAIIDHGRIITSGTPDELKKMLDGKITIEVTLNPEAMNEETEGDLKKMSGVNLVEIKSNRIKIGVNDDAVIEARVSEIDIIRPTLDDVILHLTGREIR